MNALDDESVKRVAASFVPFLDFKEVVRLSMTSKVLREVCDAVDVWERLLRRHFGPQLVGNQGPKACFIELYICGVVNEPVVFMKTPLGILERTPSPPGITVPGSPGRSSTSYGGGILSKFIGSKRTSRLTQSASPSPSSEKPVVAPTLTPSPPLFGADISHSNAKRNTTSSLSASTTQVETSIKDEGAVTSYNKLTTSVSPPPKDKLFDDDDDDVDGFFAKHQVRPKAPPMPTVPVVKIKADPAADPYRTFLKHLYSPECSQVKKAFEEFFRGFDKQVRGMSMDGEATVVMNFLLDAESTMHHMGPWPKMSEDAFGNAKNSMHKYVFENLFSKLYLKKHLQEKDTAFWKHTVSLFPHIKPHHLELRVTISDEDILQHAQDGLVAIDEFQSPWEKLTCILNACIVLTYMLQGEGSSAGADDFLPLLIYLVIRSKLPHMHSNLSYISRFIDPEERFGEAYCYFTHLISATTFIETLTVEEVTKCAESSILSNADSKSSKKRKEPATPSTPLKEAPSSTELSVQPPTSNSTKDISDLPGGLCDLRAGDASQSLSELLNNLCYTNIDISTITPEQTAGLYKEYMQLVKLSQELVQSHRNSVPSKGLMRKRFKEGQSPFQNFTPTQVPMPPEIKNPRLICVVQKHVWVVVKRAILIYTTNTCEPTESRIILPAKALQIIPAGGKVFCSLNNGTICCIDPSALLYTQIREHDVTHLNVSVLFPVTLHDNGLATVWAFGINVSFASSQLVILPAESQENPQYTVHTLDGVIVQCGLQTNRTLVWLGTSHGDILVYGVENFEYKVTHSLPSRIPVTAMCSSSSGIWVSQDGVLLCLSSSGSVITQCPSVAQHPHTTTIISYSNFVVTGHDDGAVCVWEAGTGTLVDTLRERNTTANPPTSATNTNRADEPQSGLTKPNRAGVNSIGIVSDGGSGLLLTVLWAIFSTHSIVVWS